MTFLDFQKAFTSFPVISTKEISIQFPAYNRNVLTKWQEKGYLTKIRNGYYRLTENKLKGEEDAFFMSNHIYTPSYVSLQSALRWYDFIPEGVFMVTSISTRKTNDFNSSYGSFSYRKISREFFWGYRMHAFGPFYFKIASPEKALLDFLKGE